MPFDRKDVPSRLLGHYDRSEEFGRQCIDRMRTGKYGAASAYVWFAWHATEPISRAVSPGDAKLSALGPNADAATSLWRAVRERVNKTPEGRGAERVIDGAWKAAWADPKAAVAVWKEAVRQVDELPGRTEVIQRIIERFFTARAARPLGPDEEECWKCYGWGYLPWFAYYAKGVCFACGGTGRQRALLPVAFESQDDGSVVVTLENVEEYRVMANRPTIPERMVMDRKTFDEWATRALRRHDVASIRRASVYRTMIEPRHLVRVFV